MRADETYPTARLTDETVRDIASRLARGLTCLKREIEAIGVRRWELKRALVHVCGEARAAEVIKAGWVSHIGRQVGSRRRVRKRTKTTPSDTDYSFGWEQDQLEEGEPIEVPLGRSRVLIVQLIGSSLVRLASGCRSRRGGSMLCRSAAAFSFRLTNSTQCCERYGEPLGHRPLTNGPASRTDMKRHSSRFHSFATTVSYSP